MWVEVKGKNLAQLTTTVPSAFSTICQTRRAEHAKTREPDGVLLFLFWQSLDVYTRVSADLHTSTINHEPKSKMIRPLKQKYQYQLPQRSAGARR